MARTSRRRSGPTTSSASSSARSTRCRPGSASAESNRCRRCRASRCGAPDVRSERMMRELRLKDFAAALVALGLITFAGGPRARAADTFNVSELARHTHIHGLAVDRNDPAHLLIATHHGLFRANPDGKAERVSVVQDFMG